LPDLEVLLEGSRLLGVALERTQAERLLRHLDLVYVWNRTAGLTTIPRERAVCLHLLDSLAALPLISDGPCLDLGTGAGLPGLVLAIARPDLSVVLVESNRRKCSFLMEAIRQVGIPNARVLEADADTLPSSERWPTVISRAFRPPPEFLAIAASLGCPGGRILLLMADPSESELDDLAAGSGLHRDRTVRLRLPGGGESRAIVSFRVT
jgi:16S rRNA (guanine527-N7)-methyltransferase